jgi:RNA polymerase sigma factor (sigma-70 family)
VLVRVSSGTTGDPARRDFLELLERHGPALMRLCAAYTSTAADREDLFQEICLAIWRALPGFRGDCSKRTFIYRIGHNRGLSFRSRQRPTARLDEVPEPEAPERPADELLDARSRADALLAAVRRLPALQREAIVLHLEGLSPREIADVLGITENNAAVRLTRARQSLRLELEHFAER